MGGIIEGATQLYTSIDQGNAERQALGRQFDRDQRQADLAIQSAQEKGAFESGKQRMMTSQLVAKQRQAYQASGVDPTQGTAAAVQADTAALGEMDAQQLAINAAREVWGYREGKRQNKEDYAAGIGNSNRKTIGGAVGGLAKYGQGWMQLGGGGG